MASSTIKSHNVLIVAAEASSSLYAKRLLEEWRASKVDVHAFGIGSRDMEALGFEILGRSEDMAVVGLQEVIAHYKDIKAVFLNLVAQAEERRPDFILLLDYPDFNLRLAQKLKKLNIPIIYFISPQVWAWRKGRIKTIKQVVDRMLVILPFEKEFYDKNGVVCDFVGHPLLDEIPATLFDSGERERDRKRYGVRSDEFLLGLMPGSRHSELKHNFLSQLEAAQVIARNRSHVKIALLVAPTFDIETMRAHIPHLDMPLIMMKDESTKMVSLCDAVLCASGTATLVVGLMEKPMVIMYKMNAFTAMIAKMFVTDTPFFGLINLVLGKRAVPELFQEQASRDNLVREIERYVDDSSYYQSVVSDLKLAKVRLGEKGAIRKVRQILDRYWRV